MTQNKKIYNFKEILCLNMIKMNHKFKFCFMIVKILIETLSKSFFCKIFLIFKFRKTKLLINTTDYYI